MIPDYLGNSRQKLKKTRKLPYGSSRFFAVIIAVAMTGAALFFADITPASLHELTSLANLEQKTGRYLTRLEQTWQAGTIEHSGDEASVQPPPELTRIEGTLQSGDTLSDALKSSMIGEPVQDQIIKALAGLLDFRSLRPYDRFTVTLDQTGELVEFGYEAGPLNVYRLWRTADNGLQGEKVEVNLERRTEMIAGEITSSLSAALLPYGESRRLVYTFAEIFASRIDFNTETRTGDRFSLIFEKYYKNGEFVGYGHLLSASYQPVGGAILEAFRYESPTTPPSYFDRHGNEIGASFLRSPVPAAKVSSGFSYRRKHPILGVVRPHLAVDLAAPEGTPVMATADGKVVFRALDGGNGNIVIIDHGNGYHTQYAHLSRFRRGLKEGEMVRQKEIIGYIGSTGLATGPHLCYRVQDQGRYVNPLTLKFKPRSVLKETEQAAFHEQVREITRLAGYPGEKGRVLKVHNIMVRPEDRLVLL